MLMELPSYTTCKQQSQVFLVISNLSLGSRPIMMNVPVTFYIRVVHLRNSGISSLNWTVCVKADEWKNFLERMLPDVEYNQLGIYNEDHVTDTLQLRLWASYRGQTLARTGG